MKKKFFCRQICLNGGINKKAQEIVEIVNDWDGMLVEGVELKMVATALEAIVEEMNENTKRMRPASVRYHEIIAGGASILVQIGDQMVANFYFYEVKSEINSIEDFFQK